MWPTFSKCNSYFGFGKRKILDALRSGEFGDWEMLVHVFRKGLSLEDGRVIFSSVQILLEYD